MALILVIDDRAENRELLKVVLRSAQHTVIEAANGADGLSLAQTRLPDMIIVDVVMPEMDGFQFVRELRADPETAATRVILSTATYGSEEVRRLALSCGVSHILAQPVEPAEILEIVESALASTTEGDISQPEFDFGEQHLRAVNAKLHETVNNLEGANQLWQAVMDNMAEGLYVLDAKGDMTYMNPAASRMLGYTALELAGKDMHEAIHYQRADGSAYPSEECDLMKARIEGRRLPSREDCFTRSDGTIIPVSYSSSPLPDPNGGFGAIIVFHDTTEERAAQTRTQRELNALSWLGRVRDALDDERLVLYAQPILPLNGGDASQELLIRMVGREGEVTPPGSFLPVAEKYGLITEIDEWVTRRAIEIAATGQRSHANLSADSIGNSDLLKLIEVELAAQGADPLLLVFEITETALMGNLETGEEFARGITELGCKLALDDFGTGFGTFIYLKRLPIDYLKIDIEFVRDLPSSDANQHVVKAIVNLARGFGNETIAEGVEDARTLELLKEYGVDYAQGFHLGRPAPLND